MSDWPGRRRGGSTRLPPPPGISAPGFDGLRLTVDEAEESLAEAADRLALPKSLWARDDFNLLAISGGAAGGAFGAGALVGMTRAGVRPHFAIVTGVSTGALLAPFAFLGSEWDEQLTDAYIGGHASRLLGGPLGTALGGLLRAEGLERLISPFVDERMIDAVAREHAAGRRLLVATTDLDRQKTVIWDMGAIASRGGEEAVTLFRNVLIASASLPGIFPPKRFKLEIDGEAFEELHVDGGVSTPLFLMPEAMLRWRNLRRRLHRGRVYVIVNTVLEQAPRVTQPGLPSVLMRSFDTMLRFSYRQALGLAATFCSAHNLPLSVTSILDDPANGSMLSFETASMKRIFDQAAERAEAGTLWSVPIAEKTGLLQGFRPW